MNAAAPSRYDGALAALYDEWLVTPMGTGPVDVLAELAADGPALELGIGTGRIALPLLERGVDIRGIDASEHMVAQLRSKPGGERIPVVAGDFADVPVTGDFSLVYVLAGTFFELPTQAQQVRCFENVARVLRPGGAFALDGLVPDTTLLLADQGRVIRSDGDTRVLRFREYAPATRRLVSHYLVISPAGVRHLPFAFLYASPGELDLMAALCGLRLRSRWGGWRGDPFTDLSTRHVSVYERPG